MTGTLLVGAKGLYDTLAGKKPVVIGNGLTTDDFTTTAGYSLFTGAVGVVAGMAHYVATQVQPKPKKVAVMYGDNASAQGAFSLLLKPVLDKAGIKVTGIQVKDPGRHRRRGAVGDPELRRRHGRRVHHARRRSRSASRRTTR